jgi:tRNA A-37 threonylcarbamoyl transferase component Bud32
VRPLGLLTSMATVMGLRWIAVIVLLVQRRVRHAVVFVLTFVGMDWAVARLLHVDLPRPTATPIEPAAAYAFPSPAVAALAITLFSAVMAFTTRGRARRNGLLAAVLLLALVIFGRLYLGSDLFTGSVYAVALAAGVATVMFRWLAPEESFPVADHRGSVAAHLDLGGERRTAIVRAMADQLGLTVVGVEPFGLEGSGGSSPLRMTLADGTRLFGKIYSSSHERADRWYRIGRTILYGQLEDETPTGSVRRLAAYEDYALRFLDDHGVPVAHPYGVVELTPSHEYLVVTELFEDAAKLGDPAVDDTVIDDGLRLVRTMWDIGVAHRDIKPANLLVCGGQLQLVDVSNLQIRPSPWRQAVDLANMMLTLALVTYPERVYAIAQRYFTPAEIAEAFASTEALTIPTELQARLKRDGRPILQRYRALAPEHERISIQRWSARRVAIIAAAWLSASVVVTMFVDSLGAGVM